MATLVKFLKDTDQGEVFAYFPQLNYNKRIHGNDMKQSYAHIGQHSACSKWYAADCELASFGEYADLYQELTEIGYNLHILNN